MKIIFKKGDFFMAKSKLIEANKKIEEKFVDSFRTKDGETVEEAKERLKK